MKNQMKTASEVKNSNRTRTLAHETRKNKQWLSMLVIAVFVISTAFTSCGGGSGSGGSGGKSSGKIMMTTEASGGEILLVGSGIATVDWGDGSEKVSLTLNESNSNYYGLYGIFGVRFEHTYPNATIRTITINGDNITTLGIGLPVTSLDVSKNTELTELACFWGGLTSLDVSKNTALTVLGCQNNQLTNLDVSKNTALTILNCRNNQFSGSALNALFGTLHNNAGDKYIIMDNNPGASDCDRSIAERKGWTFQ